MGSSEKPLHPSALERQKPAWGLTILSQTSATASAGGSPTPAGSRSGMAALPARPVVAARLPPPASVPAVQQVQNCSSGFSAWKLRHRSGAWWNQRGTGGSGRETRRKINTKRAFQPAASKSPPKETKRQVTLEATGEDELFSKGHTLPITAWAKHWTCRRGKRRNSKAHAKSYPRGATL